MDKKKQKHLCPPIPDGFTVKITGPAYVDGESVATARAKHAAFKRILAAHAKPMPRTTQKKG